MKPKIISTLAILIITTANLFAQPLPPSSPDGNPVPIGGLSILLLVAGGLLLFLTRKKNK